MKQFKLEQVLIAFIDQFGLVQAGLICIEVKFEEWQWEEELHVFTLEEVGLGIFFLIW